MKAVDPQAWLTQTLERLANGWPSSKIDALMPWNYRMPAAKAVCLELVISSKSMAYVMRYIDFPH
jgi:hypothetical protein